MVEADSEESESSNLEEEIKEDKEKIVEEEFVLPEMKEEEIEKWNRMRIIIYSVDIDLSEVNGNSIISFSIMFLSKCFMIQCSSEIPLDMVLNKISVRFPLSLLCIGKCQYKQEIPLSS